MEAALFMLDALCLVVMVIMTVKNERRPPSEPQTGPFRYIETRHKPKPPLAARWNRP